MCWHIRSPRATVALTDALGKTTYYGYNVDTGVLEWVQYPNDTETSRTTYTYDDMYRMASAAANVSGLVGGTGLSVNYTFENDLLTKIKTPSTEYTFSYGAFAQRTSIHAGNYLLASYKYTEDKNQYLEKLTYGNGGTEEYTYDDKGRIETKTFGNNDTVTYTYDNDGNLATVTDSATGITTTYYYDLLGRQMKYVENNGTKDIHSVEYEYDLKNNLSVLTETVGSVEHTAEYDYDSENRLTKTDYGTVNETVEYDNFGRMSSTALEIEAEEPAEGEEAAENETVTQTAFQYKTEGNKTSSKLSAVTVTGNSNNTLDSRYSYDKNGNITHYQLLDADGETLEDIHYHYDTANQLVREDNLRTNTTTRWVYDNAGNIRERKEYTYTTETIENWDALTASDEVAYTYGDTSWKDLLTAYDGQAITYDTIGNPLNDGTWTYTWQNGRELASMTTISDGTDGDDSNSVTWEYAYDVNGMRVSRKNGNTVYSYVYNGSQLTQMTKGSDTLYFTYGVLGPTTVTWNGTTYYYAINAQGDVTGIFDGSGNCVVTYQWKNAWGYDPTPTGSLAATLGTLNPLRYRSYVYDTETGLYYLQSRYYDPEIGRFINADNYPTTGQGLTGNNMFAYCGNNPVSRKDDGGELWEIVVGAAIGGGIAGAIIGTVSHLVNCGMSGSEVTVSGLLGAAATGAFTGAIGAVGGAIGSIAVVASVGVGIVSGVTTAINTDGSTTEKIAVGLSSGVVAGFGTYLGTKIPVATDSTFTTGFTSFTGGLFMGTLTEIVNVASQQIVSKVFDITQSSKSASARSSTSRHSHSPVSRVSLAY